MQFTHNACVAVKSQSQSACYIVIPTVWFANAAKPKPDCALPARHLVSYITEGARFNFRSFSVNFRPLLHARLGPFLIRELLTLAGDVPNTRSAS